MSAAFPEAFCVEIAAIVQDRMPDHAVLLRPLRGADPAMSIGIYPAAWVPMADTAVIGQPEPQMARYGLKVQNMVKALTEAEGQALFSIDAKVVRAILYRDAELRVRLAGLSEEMFGTVERVKRYDVVRQDFQRDSGTQQGFVFLATTDLNVDTETTNLQGV